MLWGAVSWVPDTFLTRNIAAELFDEIKQSALERDKDLHRQLTLNYYETQIALNRLIIQDYEKRKEQGRLSTDDEIAYEAIIKGQADLIVERNKLVKGEPEWLE